MEIVTAARRHLLTSAAVTGYVQNRVWKHSLLEPVTGTGRAALVLRLGGGGGWAEPDGVQTAEYPLLVVECWADCTRDDDGLVARDDAIDRAFALYRVVDPLLHAKRDVWWGGGWKGPGLRILHCQRDSDPGPAVTARTFRPGTGAPDFGDSAKVEGIYRVHTHH